MRLIYNIILSGFLASLSMSSSSYANQNKIPNIRPDQIIALIETLNFIPAETQQSLLKSGLEVLVAYNNLPPAKQILIRNKMDNILKEISAQNHQ